MAYSHKKHMLDIAVIQGIRSQDIDLVRKCLKEGVSLKKNRLYKGPLIKMTVNENCPSIFELLISVGANVFVTDDSGNLLHVACAESYRIYNELFKNSEQDLLREEAEQNYMIIQRLIELGVDVNYQNKLGETPLDMCGSISTSPYELLLSHGAEHNKYAD